MPPLDQAEGLLRWAFADHTAVAPAQFIGTYSTAGNSWMWAWAHDFFLSSMCSASETGRRWGEQNDQPMPTNPSFDVDEQGAADLAVLAFRLSDATGFYRAPAGLSHVYMTFGPVTIVDDDGAEQVSRSTFPSALSGPLLPAPTTLARRWEVPLPY